jgi:hypothetical protein
VKKHYSDTLAVDMEDYGFLEAAHANPSIDALVIRGISDLINNKGITDKLGWQEKAARNASAFAFEVLARLSSRITTWPGSEDEAAPVLSRNTDSRDRFHSQKPIDGDLTAQPAEIEVTDKIDKIIVCLKLRGLERVLSSGRLSDSYSLVNRLFDNNPLIAKCNANCIDKLLGNLSIWHIERAHDPTVVYQAVSEIRDSLKAMKPLLRGRQLTMSAFLMRQRGWATEDIILSPELITVLRLSEWIDADAVFVSEGLRTYFLDGYVTMRVSDDPPFYAVLRETTHKEMQNKVRMPCAKDCEWTDTCQAAHMLGQESRLLDCHECHERFVETDHRTHDACFLWCDCADKLVKKTNFGISPCCPICERHLSCFQSYWAGRRALRMFRCKRYLWVD